MSDSDPKTTFRAAIEGLSARKVAYLHYIERMSADPVIHVSLAEARSWFSGPLMVNGGFTKERAVEVLSEKLADIVAFGVPYISNPDLVERFKSNAPLAEADQATFYGGDEKGYTDYPSL
jgi:N-ethylmaleimide reductase